MKRVFYILVVIISCFLLVGCTQKDTKKNSSNETKTEEKDSDKEFSKEEAVLDENSKEVKLLNELSKYGLELYQSKKYTDYSKKNSMYFISLTELNSKYSYDISDFVGEDGTVCDKEESGIYFDPDNVMKLEYTEDFPPVLPMLVGCSKDEVKDSSK